MKNYSLCGIESVPPVQVPQQLQRVLLDFLSSERVFLTLWGPPGTYKTTGAKKLLIAYVEKKGEVSPWYGYFVRFADIEKALEEEETCEIMKGTRLLIVDDLIFEGYPERVWLKFFNIIDIRYSFLRKTVITTNHDVRTFTYGGVSLKQRIASRLCDINLGVVYEVKNSYRNPKGGGAEW